jgi:hypothetical protein
LCFIPWKFHKFIVIGHWENIWKTITVWNKHLKKNLM